MASDCNAPPQLAQWRQVRVTPLQQPDSDLDRTKNHFRLHDGVTWRFSVYVASESACDACARQDDRTTTTDVGCAEQESDVVALERDGQETGFACERNTLLGVWGWASAVGGSRREVVVSGVQVF